MTEHCLMEVRKTCFHPCCWCTDRSVFLEYRCGEKLRRNQPWCRFQFWTWPLGQRLFLQVALTPCFHLQGTAREANQEKENPQNNSKDWGYCLLLPEQSSMVAPLSAQLGCPFSFYSIKLWIMTWKDSLVCLSVKDWNKGLLSHLHGAPRSLIEY